MNQFRFVTTLALSALVALAPISMAAPDGKSGGKTGRSGKPGREGRRGYDPAKRLERMGEFLNLTAAQKSKLKPIFENSKKQFESLRTNTSLSPEKKRERMRVIRTETDKKVNAVLTAAQRKKLQEMKAKMKERRENRGAERPLA